MDQHNEENHELNDHLVSSHSPLFDHLRTYRAHPNETTPPLSNTQVHSTTFLDGLRGLAALFVCIQHFIGSFDANVHEHGFGEHGNYYLASLPFLRIVFSGGSAAVAIFFVLSGYVLSKSPVTQFQDGERHTCGMSLASAVVRRPIRLYVPTLGVTLAVALLMHAPLGVVPELSWALPKDTVFAEMTDWLIESIKFFNPFQTHGSNRAWFRYSLVVWTIPIELKGSMLVYASIAIHIFTGSTLSLSLSLQAITVIVLLHLGKWTMACFIAGLILACIDVYSLDTVYLARHCTPRAQSLLRHACFITGYYLLCQPAHAGNPDYSLGTPGWHHLTLLAPSAYDKDQYFRYWHSWGALLVLYSALRIQWLQQLLNIHSLRYLGKVSFMLYLVHLPILSILGDRVGRMFGNLPKDPKPSWWNNKLYIPNFGPWGMNSRFLASLAIVLPVCLSIADLATKILDTPSVRISKRIVRRLGLDKGVSALKGVRAEGAGLPDQAENSLMLGRQLPNKNLLL